MRLPTLLQAEKPAMDPNGLMPANKLAPAPNGVTPPKRYKHQQQNTLDSALPASILVLYTEEAEKNMLAAIAVKNTTTGDIRRGIY